MIWFSNPPLWGEGRVGVQQVCTKHKTPFFDLLTVVTTPKNTKIIKIFCISLTPPLKKEGFCV